MLKYAGDDRIILNYKLQIMVREKGVSYSMLIAHYFPRESGRNSLTLSRCTSTASTNIQGGSNMTGTDLCVNKPHCAAAVRP